MSLLSVVRDVCAAVGVEIPTSVFTNINANRTMQEMLALSHEMAQRIAYDTRDWTALHTNAQLDPAMGTLAGGVLTLPLPADYKRMLLNTNLRKYSSPTQPLTFISDADQWRERRLSGEASNGWGEWTLSGANLKVYPTLAVTDFIDFMYLDKNCIALDGGGFGDRFMNDADGFRLDERLLKLGMTWQWKALKGSPYAEDMGTFSDALANAIGRDKPAPIIIGRRNASSYDRVAYPWATP